MIHTSEQINEIAAALAKAQATIENVEKDATNPAFKREGAVSHYTTLGAALDEVRPKLAAQGVAIVQMPVNGEGNNIGLATRLLHSSGQWIESTLYVAPAQFTAQGAGSVITYLRRYALMAMTGIAPEDDDGNAATVAAPQPQRAGMVRAADVPPQQNYGQDAAGAGRGPAGLGPLPAPQKANGNGTNDATDIARRAAIFRSEMMGWFAKCKLPADVGTIIKNNGKALDGLKKMAPDVYDEIMAESNRITNEMYGATG